MTNQVEISQTAGELVVTLPPGAQFVIDESSTGTVFTIKDPSITASASTSGNTSSSGTGSAVPVQKNPAPSATTAPASTTPASPPAQTITEPFLTISYCGLFNGNQIQIHGSVPAGGMPAVDLSLDGGKTWTSRGTPGTSGGGWDIFVGADPGTYTPKLRDGASPANVVTAPNSVTIPGASSSTDASTSSAATSAPSTATPATASGSAETAATASGSAETATAATAATAAAPASSTAAPAATATSSAKPGMVLTNASLTPNQLWVHGPWPATPWSQYDYTIDGGKTWVPAGGFANDGGTFDSWVYNMTNPAGTYNVGIRDHNNPSDVSMYPTPLVINPNTAPATVTTSSIKFSNATPNGFIVGKVVASGGTPQNPLTLSSTMTIPPGLTLVGAGSGTWNIVVADQTKLVAGMPTLSGSIMSGDLGKEFTATIPIESGKIIDASAMTFSQSTGLTNATPLNSVIGNAVVEGYSAGAFGVYAQAGVADGSNMAARYAFSPTISGQLINTNTLAAQNEQVTLMWTDGTDVCLSPQTISIQDVIGHGPSLSVTDQASLVSVMQETQSDPLGKYAGAVVTVAAGLTFNSGWVEPGAADGWNGNGFLGPIAFIGARGVMTQLTQTGSWVPNGKGWLETLGWDVRIQGFEFANLAQSYPGEVGNFAAIKLNADCLGATSIDSIFSHNCTDGVLGGFPGQIITITNSEFAKNGGGDGYTHNFYLNTASYALVKRVVSWGANVGHCGKARCAAGLVQDSVFADGPNGCASYNLDIPDGGDWTVQNTIIEKGPNGQNSPLISYGEECANHHPVNNLVVDGCTFINRAVNPPKLYNGDTINPVGVYARLASGAPCTVTIKNSKFYGFNAGQAWQAGNANTTIIDGGGNEYLPLDQAPAQSSYISLDPTDANPTNHPWQAAGYTSSTKTLAGYLAGPMSGQ
jgi:hypothetical protein